MYGIAALFFYVIFKSWITPELSRDYLAGAVLLGAAPCFRGGEEFWKSSQWSTFF